MIPKTPKPPYYAVIFTSKITEIDQESYGTMADRMVDLAVEQDGYIGYESYRNDDGYGTTISYWQSLDAISNWKKNTEHREAQQKGREKWYAAYQLRIAKIERDYGFNIW